MKALQFQTIRKLSGAKITHLRIRVLKEVFLANLKLTNNSSQTRFFRCLLSWKDLCFDCLLRHQSNILRVAHFLQLFQVCFQTDFCIRLTIIFYVELEKAYFIILTQTYFVFLLKPYFLEYVRSNFWCSLESPMI
jgi:hypothetical protein